MPTPIHVRIVSTYPADFGLPEETTDVTMQLRPEFASTPEEAHERIREALTVGEIFEIPAMRDPEPFRFTPEYVDKVMASCSKTQPSVNR